VIAFNSERAGNTDIYIMNADGNDQRRLTDDPAYDAWPSWSPDGSQIAFVSTRNGNPDIFIMDADGSNLRQLTDHPANDIWPAWSLDGTRIAFPSRQRASTWSPYFSRKRIAASVLPAARERGATVASTTPTSSDSRPAPSDSVRMLRQADRPIGRVGPLESRAD